MTELPPSAGAPPDLPPADVASLFRTHRRPMTQLAYVLTSDASAADEIVQDAFVQLHARWARIDNPVGYLRTAVVNGCRSHHRHRAVLRRTPQPRPEAALLAADELSDALAKLPYRQRAALALRYFADLPDEEIATALSIRPATVRSLIHRGLGALRQEIVR